ncbi:MAG: GTP cyclohydrolase I, partial [Candidatus Acidiferrales bacterium]
MSEITDTETIHLAKTDNAETIADLVRRMIVLLGEDPNREGLRRTPERFEKALRYLTSGYRQDPEKL